MSYTELEHGYQDLRSTTNQPIFYVGDIGAGQAGLVGPGGSPLYCPANRGELSEGCVNEDGFLAGGEPEGEGKQVLVGICAMAKKSQSKPMKEILTRLEEFEYIKIIVFAEEVILKEPVDKWPVVDCLISFHSKGFPLDKAIKYAELRNPFIINNLDMQYDIQDRRRVYAILEGEGIEIPRYAVLDRDSPDPKHFLPEHELVESEDHVEVNGVTFNKPFVEKPVSAEDHNIYIYYPTSAGGGSQRLFRKIGSRSSVYSPESRVRKTGSYIYEDFMPTDGTDVKVYTVGPDYAHAEARKSPALDGKVERDSEGKEIRYPVILSNAEKLISRKVCMAFKQTVCGFDLLRANGQSFVCDVNGFSFVKNSNKYYDDCAKILGNMILRELAPTLHIPWSVPFQLDDPPIVPTTFGKMMELRCVVAVIRHGDRTPKQKMKVEVRHPKFFEIFAKYDGYKHGHVKLKRPKQLQEILDTARSLLAEIQHRAAGPELEEKQGKLEQLKSVLEMYGHFSGINRKVQMKYQPRGRPRGSSSDDGSSSNRLGEPSLVLILKWGGELTPAGRIQAEELGRIFRCMYPGGQGRHLSGEYAGAQGLGLLRLHSTFRHDLKIYASDEGRVQMTAAAFAKGLLALEGELTPILVQMVKSANTNGLLDNDCDSSKYQNMVKNRLHEYFQQDRDFTDEDREKINPTNALSINTALDFVKNPVRCCQHVHMLIQKLMDIVRIKKDDPKTKDAILYHGETWELMGRRWGKIEKDFCTKQKRFDISKIPDIYDCIKYDLQHNNHTLQFEQAEELYIYSKYLADIVIPQEYGLTVQEKLTIGQGICTPLLKKIRADLQRNIEEPGEESVNRLNPRYSHGVSSPGRHVRTRLYFTSESHVHSLLTVLRYGGLLDVLNDEQWRRAMEYVSMVSELNYMSQIVVMLYEDPTKDPSSEERFHVELHFSPGVNCCVQKNLPPGPGFRPHSRNESSHNLQDVGSGQDSNCSTRIEEEDTEVGQLEEDVATPPQEPEVSTTIIEVDPVDAADAADSTLDSPTTSRAINMMDLDPNIMDEPYDSGFLQSSAPIPISARTVAGHEAARLGSQLAASQRQRREREAAGIICEPRARSYDHQRQDKPEKTADKLQYQSLDAVDNEASRSPKLADIFPDDCLSSKPAPLAGSLPHSVSSPDLALSPVVANVLPIINVVEEPAAPPAAPNKTTTTTTTPVAIPAPLITLHNTPLASPGTIATATAAAAAAAAAASSDVIDFSLAAANVVATNNRSNAAAAASSQKIVAVNDNGQSTSLSSSSNNARSQMLQLPGSNACYVVKKYGRSHSAMTLPVIEISGESTPPRTPVSLLSRPTTTTTNQDDDDDDNNCFNNDDELQLLLDDETSGDFLLPPDKRRLLLLRSSSSSPLQRRHRHHHHHHHHHYHYHYHHHYCQQNFAQTTAASRQQRHSLSSNQLEIVTEALLEKRSRSPSPAAADRCNCYNCNVSELIMQSSDLSPAERSNFRTYFSRSLSHKFSNCSCYAGSPINYHHRRRHSRSPRNPAAASADASSSASSYDAASPSSSSPPTPENGLVTTTTTNYAMKLTRSNSCPDSLLKFATFEEAVVGKRRRHDSLDSVLSSSSSCSLPSCATKLHPSCSLDCLRTTPIGHNYINNNNTTFNNGASMYLHDNYRYKNCCCCCCCCCSYCCWGCCCCCLNYSDVDQNDVDEQQQQQQQSSSTAVTAWLESHSKCQPRRSLSGSGCCVRAKFDLELDPRHKFINANYHHHHHHHNHKNRNPHHHHHHQHCPVCINNPPPQPQQSTNNYVAAINQSSHNNQHQHHHHHHHHHNKHHHHQHHHHHCPSAQLRNKLQQQRSFSSPDTRPSIIQPDPTTCNTARRHRHSISGQMSYFKLLGYNVSKKLTGSANSLFSTAVISGSSSAPNLKDMVPPHASAVAAIEGFGGVPPIRPLETLHNALSLRQLDVFLEMMTGAPLFRTPASSPPKSSPIGPGPNGTAAAAASSTAAGGGAGGHHQNLGIEAARYITPNPINCKGNGAAGGSSHEAELIADLKFQASPTSPNSKSEVARKQQQQRKYANETDAKIVKSPAAGTGWSSEPASFLSSEPSSPAPTSAGECSMSMSLVSNDGQKYTSNLDIDFDDFCANIEQQQQQQQQQQHQLLQQEALRESRGSVSYTDYYSNEDGQIRQRAALGGDNCFPVYVKPPSSSDGDASPTAEVDEAEEEEEEEDNNLTIKQEDAERQKKQDVQLIFEQKQSQEAAKAGSSYKKIGRFLVESRNPNEMLSSSLASADSKGTPLPTTGGGGGGGGSSSDPKKNLLRSQSVYTPKSILSSGGAKSATSLQKQSSLSMSANVQFPSDQEQQQQQQQPQPQLTLASSITDKAHVTFGFDVAQNKQN
ncbi:inositol hexakisphosphate and diphosphoinositol-pentakisphosphate kinase isoform X4 [Trichogramma pretiosum]|uniref:inositol hexakisphosphate and diphosphoinositol-pentakisphosphate kinase isoform X4 n=1 Tax=Trichogramma pretiosum TaxID=7493 RepID=UPI000C71B29C|nr:inositol hexakisphosphate and diphosphoinositol-pentakisphosphate kinase isoform X4 [Trichogramma pretiosum]